MRLTQFQTILYSHNGQDSQKQELMEALHNSFSSFVPLLFVPPPNASDRTQVLSRHVWLPGGLPILLSEQDVEIALRLSDDLHLNEIDCARLIVSADSGGRETPLNTLERAIGLWYTERRDLLTDLISLLKAAVLDQLLTDEIASEIQQFLQRLINDGLRQRLIFLIEELPEEVRIWTTTRETYYVLDSNGVRKLRRDVVSQERLTLGHCLVLSILVGPTSPRDVNDIFSCLKYCASELGETIILFSEVRNQAHAYDWTGQLVDKLLPDCIERQITISLLFSLVIALVTDALCAASEKSSVLSVDAYIRLSMDDYNRKFPQSDAQSVAHKKAPALSMDASFICEFHENVMAAVDDPYIKDFVGTIQLAWAVHLMLIQSSSLDSISSSISGYLQLCLEAIFSKNVFHLILENVIQTESYQKDAEGMSRVYNVYFHKLITCFLSLAKDTVIESMGRAVNKHANRTSLVCGSVPLPIISLFQFIGEIYQGPGRLSGNDALWTFLNVAKAGCTNLGTIGALLDLLSTLVYSRSSASKVYELLQPGFKVQGEILFDSLSNLSGMDVQVLVSYLNVLAKVVCCGDPLEIDKWFPDIEPLFKLLDSCPAIPEHSCVVDAALQNAITAFVYASPELKDAVCRYLVQYNLPPAKQNKHDMVYEMHHLRGMWPIYGSTMSYLNLVNALISEEMDRSVRGLRFISTFRFIHYFFCQIPALRFFDIRERWQLTVACLRYFYMMLSLDDEDFDNSSLSTPTDLDPEQPNSIFLYDFMHGESLFRTFKFILLLCRFFGLERKILKLVSKDDITDVDEAVKMSLDIIIVVLKKDSSDYSLWVLESIRSMVEMHAEDIAKPEPEFPRFFAKIRRRCVEILNILRLRYSNFSYNPKSPEMMSVG